MYKVSDQLIEVIISNICSNIRINCPLCSTFQEEQPMILYGDSLSNFFCPHCDFEFTLKVSDDKWTYRNRSEHEWISLLKKD